MVILEAKNIYKKYGSHLALDGFSLTLEKGEIISLLGPNGAGKTTFVKSVLGLLSISSGEIEVFGSKVTDDSVKSRLSYLPEKFTFYSYFTIEGTLSFYAKMYGVDKSEIEAKINIALERIGILDIKGKKISDLSKGQLQRVGIACAIVADHEFIILDEPFSGLDPIGMKEVKDLCHELKAEGKTVLINSHILSEMEKIADKVIIMNKGQIKANGTVSEVSNGMSLEERFYQIVKGGSDD